MTRTRLGDEDTSAPPSGRRSGRLVGERYTLEALIGRGGMGEVWRARHVALKTPVAIKFLQSAACSSERARRRFLTEAQVTASLRTRHAVQVFDFGVTGDGVPYLVMELLDGETLEQRIAREGRLSVTAASRVLQTAARALERAHALGIVHRDFKPENVMLVADDEEGELVKVVDFGIAKLVGDLDDALRRALGSLAQARAPQPSASDDDAPPSSLGATGGVGTPYYMAPEQIEDSVHVGPAADIWAFGVVAYECLTGRKPFDDESIGKLLLRVLAAEPPPPASSIAPVPALFDDWFRVACARVASNRFPDVQSAASALAVALDTRIITATTPPAIAAAGAAAGEPESAPILSSQRRPVVGPIDEPTPERTVSPLAATLSPTPTPAPVTTDLTTRAPLVQEMLPDDEPRDHARPERFARLWFAAASRSLMALALLIALVAGDARAPSASSFHGARAVASDPAPTPEARTNASFETPSLEAPSLDAHSLDTPSIDAPCTVAASAPLREPDPPAAAAPATTAAHARRRTSEARPSAYKLPPLGL